MDLDLAIGDLVDETAGDRAGNGNGGGERDRGQRYTAGWRGSRCRAAWDRCSSCSGLAGLDWNSWGWGHWSSWGCDDGGAASRGYRDRSRDELHRFGDDDRVLGDVLRAKTLIACHGGGLFRDVLFIVGDTLEHFRGDFVLFAVAVVVRVASTSLEVVVC